jgi:hypothetical protein
MYRHERWGSTAAPAYPINIVQEVNDMALKAAFIFLAPAVDPDKHHATVVTPEVELTAVAVRDYAQAEEIARALVANGVTAIELCGGFGHGGAARIAAAVAGKAAVGVVRFDNHPGLDGKSGDELFGSN